MEPTQPVPLDASNATSAGVPRSRPLSEVPELAEVAARLLRTPGATLDIDDADARFIVSQMRLVYFARGAALVRQGDKTHTNYMLLIISGEVAVDTAEAGQPDAVAISVLGPGNLVGEMGMLDGLARSASCTAATAVQAASLSRNGLQRLIEQRPAVAAKLMAGISKRMAERLRALGEQLQIYAQIVAAQQAEIDKLKAPRLQR